MSKNGFSLIKKEAIKEINGTGYYYRHDKTGANLIYLECPDTNKVFTVGFKTPVTNGTGVPHIIEHSTLCGSDKYPVKEPFVELMKGSLNTFLNAFTFPDSTFYPFASANEQDYMNILDIYLDAVFYPNIYKHKEIFLQEGWHYHLENENDPITINGVVYNEMKGSYSSPERVIEEEVMRALYTSCYNHSSGGDPEEIPNLTYEGFKAFHGKFYHPSNACFYLYGDLNFDKVTKHIDKEYLSNYKAQKSEGEVALTPMPKKAARVQSFYALGENDSEKDKSFLSLGYAINEGGSPEIDFAMKILANILLNTEASPLKPLLLGQGLCANASARYDKEFAQPLFTINLVNVKDEKKEEIETLINEKLQNLLKNGIDKKLIEACLNKEEFALREASVHGYPKGLLFGMDCLFQWRYANDIFAPLKFEPMIEKLRVESQSGYFEKLLEKYILKNTHAATVLLAPQKGLSEQKNKALEQKLKAYKESLSKEEIQKIIKETKALIARQSAPDTEEGLNSIPLLSVSDIDRQGKTPLSCDSKLHGLPFLHYDVFSAGIAYVNLLFDASFVKEEDLPYVGLLAELLTKLGTEKYGYEELSKQIMIDTGDMKASCQSYADTKNSETHRPFLEFKFKMTKAKAKNAFELAKEIITSTNFEDAQRISQTLYRAQARSESYMVQAGHMISLYRVGSFFSPAMKFYENTNLYTYFDFVKKTLNGYQNNSGEVIAKLKDLADKLFTKANLTVSLTGSVEELSAISDGVADLLSKMKEGEKRAKENYTLKPAKEAFSTAGNVQYVSQGYSLLKLGYNYKGQMAVLDKILSTDYLWNRIRVQGGAYGAMLVLARTQMILVSYRDPKLAETYQNYRGIVDYLKTFDCSDRELNKYLIGTFQDLDYPVQAEQEGAKALSNYLWGISKEDIARAREEVFACKKEDIRSFAEMVEKVLDQNCIATVGSAEKIKENEKLFDKIY